MPTLFATFALVCAILLAIGLAVMIATRRPRRYHRAADAEACVTGTCGDTMIFRFSVHDGRLADISFKTKGCAYSFSCLQAAADATRGRTLRQVRAIDEDFIARKVGHIPEDHQHCASLAVQTIQRAVDNYLLNRSKKETKVSP